MWPLLIMMALQGTVSTEETKSRTETNPELFMNVSEKIQYWGYPSEEYEVLTFDGYYLSLNRIPGGSKAAVLMVHALIKERSSWVENLPHNSLGFILADASFHEMGIYDLPAFTDFILQETVQEQIYFVAHSEGSTIDTPKMWPLLIVMIVQGTVNSEDMKSKTGVNPEQFMNISERIQYWGYPSEEYEVLTADGYYLSLNRIPGGSKGAVLLIHSLGLEGGCLVANPPRTSPAFILADAGYDVWIGNHRGNSWSRRHKYLTIDQQEFWDFSFHELAIYDLPAFTDFILQKSGQEKIYCVAHAEGSAIVFFAFSVLPQLASKFRILFALGPPYTLHYNISPLLQMLRLPDRLLKIIFGTKEFRLLGPRLRAIVARTCSWPVMDVLCKQALFLVSGFNQKNLNKSRTDVYTSRFPDYTSVKQIIHWGQLAKTGKPRYFDYGSGNMQKYNQTFPPRYRIEEITVPIAMWSGGYDWVAQPKETVQLRSRLRNIIHYKYIPDYVHWDYIWGIDTPQRMYAEILSLMEN